ncbi:MAG: SDR family NAD(P)-dependent oxidoreductase [Solirubrobacteraceae bacterium]
MNGTVLLTGGAHGIGLDAARRLHARGGRVVLAHLDGAAAEREAAALGEGRALGLQVDVVDRAEVEGAVVAAVERFGGLDVVVANAGIEPEVRTVLSQHREQFDRVLAVNVGGVRHTVEAALPQIVTRRGHVVVIASIYAFINGAMAAPYAMSKAAVEAYGRALRVELAPHGATAGVAYFGFINTALVERTFAQRPVEILRQAMPAFITAPKPVGVAGEALVRGIECRSPTITAPGWVRPALRARGLLQLLDERFRRDARVHEAVRIAEAWAHAPTSTAGTAAGP